MKPAKHLLTLGLAIGAAGLLSCSTPKPECQAASSNRFGAGFTGLAAFATRLTYVGGDSGPCADFTGEVVGMQVYHPPSASDPQVRDLGQTSIAIRTWSHGEMFWMYEDWIGPVEHFCGDGIDNDEDGQTDDADGDCAINAIGEFTDVTPDDDDYCHVGPISEARVNFPGLTIPESIPNDTGFACMDDMGCDPAVDPMAPGGTCVPTDPDVAPDGTCVTLLDDVYEPTNLAYRWSNVQFYVTAAATGTQFTADVEIELNGCTAQYRAIGMWPAVDCANYITGVPDERMCHPEADPTNAELPRPYGSGINPDFGPVVCDPNFGVVPMLEQYGVNQLGHSFAAPRCVLSNDNIPSLEGFPPL